MATDSELLRDWAKQNKIRQMTVSRQRVLLYDNMYRGTVPISGADSEQLHVTWQHFIPVRFADGWADVFLYNGEDVRIYYLFDSAAVFVAASVWILIFLLGSRREIRYVKQLRKELESVDSQFTVWGNDEVTELARGLNRMTAALREKERKEKEMQAAQERLVLGMAHDLRNPLTGAAAYLEILKRMDVGPEAGKYVDRIFVKTEEIRSLSDQLFEFFLIHTKSDIHLEEPASIEFAVGEYISELCALLKSSGFSMSTENLVWENAQTQICTDYMGRIINNIYSNILKYAEPRSEIKLSSGIRKTNFFLTISNQISPKSTETESHGFGLNNIQVMMKKMNGEAMHCVKGMEFTARLEFALIS